MLLVNFSICMRVACCYLFVFVWWLFCANLLLCLGSKLPHKKRTTTTPPVWKNKKIYKAWLSLVKFVSEKYFQKESGIRTNNPHWDDSARGRTQCWPSPTSFHDEWNPELFAALEPQGLDPLDVLIFIRRPGKILEDIGGNCGMPRNNLIKSYWFIIFKRDTDPTPPQKILLNLRRHCTIVACPGKILLNLIESYWFHHV